ncbi:hypothetical protein DL95DRAFT_415784 [Leptodontidium sp. 2 PMI_412]|nr:hypothetical protein DL95DRAFT_415784 [Leptodontidium sp. 2 PMI_412]
MLILFAIIVAAGANAIFVFIYIILIFFQFTYNNTALEANYTLGGLLYVIGVIINSVSFDGGSNYQVMLHRSHRVMHNRHHCYQAMGNQQLRTTTKLKVPSSTTPFISASKLFLQSTPSYSPSQPANYAPSPSYNSANQGYLSYGSNDKEYKTGSYNTGENGVDEMDLFLLVLKIQKGMVKVSLGQNGGLDGLHGELVGILR